MSTYRKTTEPLSCPTVARQISATVTSANQALTDSIRGVSILARGCDIRYVLGSGAQTANASTSHFIANGERLDLTTPFTNPNIAIIRDTAAVANGILEVTEFRS